MISNSDLVNQIQAQSRETVLREMADNPDHEFHLTGSRFFESATSTSDYDFFTMHSKGVIEFLKSVGFVEISTSKYQDSFTKAVYMHHLGIDVQLVKDPDRKSLIQDSLKLQGFRNPTKEIWNLADHFYSLGRSWG